MSDQLQISGPASPPGPLIWKNDGFTEARCKKKIQEWTDAAKIGFKYSMKKVEQLLTKAKQKMAQKPDCTQLECTQCKESFPDEGQLRLHYESEEHLVKVREKSESKTLGDLKTFAKLKFVSESPAHLNEASMPTSNNELLGDSFDKLCAEAAPPDDDSSFLESILNVPQEEEVKAAVDTTELQARVERLEQENRELREQLHYMKITPDSLKDMQDMVVHMKKDETQGDFQKDQMGYKFPNDKFYRIMSTLDSGCNSVKELVAKMTMCSFIINRKGGDYGERSSDDDERVTKKRKRNE